jgi:sugar-specific transcriptional regulator TrmB
MRKYQQYIERAANIEEIMAVEKQIAELQHEIDKTGDEFTKLNNSIDFSTVRLTLKGPRNNDVYYIETIEEKVKSLFNRYNDYISTTISILIGLIIYGIPSLIIILLLYLALFGKIGILKRTWRLLNGNKIKNST